MLDCWWMSNDDDGSGAIWTAVEYVSAIIDASAGASGPPLWAYYNTQWLRLRFSFFMHISNNNENIIRESWYGTRFAHIPGIAKIAFPFWWCRAFDVQTMQLTAYITNLIFDINNNISFSVASSSSQCMASVQRTQCALPTHQPPSTLAYVRDVFAKFHSSCRRFLLHVIFRRNARIIICEEMMLQPTFDTVFNPFAKAHSSAMCANPSLVYTKCIAHKSPYDFVSLRCAQNPVLDARGEN